MSEQVASKFLLLVLCGLLAFVAYKPCEALSVEKYFQYEIKEFVVPVDHFSFTNTATFTMRYLFNDSYAELTSPQIPIFFYCGNEGDIEWFVQHSGLVWELAAKFHAIVVFAEHRYYGESLPFGNDTFDRSNPRNLDYFTVEQTLEDFAMLITHLQEKWFVDMPVVAFGGSYGGMLATWFRMKYPNIVTGALATSAPIWQFKDMAPCDAFFKHITSIFQNAYNGNCTINIRKSWETFEKLGKTTDGRKQLKDVFQLCEPINSDDDLKTFVKYFEEAYPFIAMANYPYKNSFLAPLPAYPVREVCSYLKDLHEDDTGLMNAISKAIGVYTNYTGSLNCFDYKGHTSNTDSAGWNMQTCNQMVQTFCKTKDTMFPTKLWNFTEFSENCYKNYGLIPKETDIILRYGNKDISGASNIIFSNGLLDPWSVHGVYHAPNDRIHIIVIPDGAHHLDLRKNEVDDPPSVREARAKEASIIETWLDEYANKFTN